MTITEYMDPARFPATTQRGLSASGQLMIDAVNYDALKEFIDQGKEISADLLPRWKELQEKMKHNARLAKEAQGK